MLDPQEQRCQGHRRWLGPSLVLSPPAVRWPKSGLWADIQSLLDTARYWFKCQTSPLLSTAIKQLHVCSSTEGREGGVQPVEGTVSLQVEDVGTREEEDDTPMGYPFSAEGLQGALHLLLTHHWPEPPSLRTDRVCVTSPFG